MKQQHLRWSITVLLLVGLLGFRSIPTQLNQQEDLLSDLRNLYLTDLEIFTLSTVKLDSLVKALPAESASLDDVQACFLETRRLFKRVEHLAAYNDPEFVKFFLNGPPLPHLPADDGGIVLEPEGMQRLEEVVFDENSLLEREEMMVLAENLGKNAQTFLAQQKNTPLNHHQVFGSVRSQLIRVFSLGVTGFDTPVAADALEEARISLQALEQYLNPYLSLLSQRNPELAEQIPGQFASAIRYLEENPDFDTFDRLAFLKDYLNPVFASVTHARSKLGVPTQLEVEPTLRELSVNDRADNIFSEDLINPFFYTQLISSVHNEKMVEIGRMLFFDPILSDGVDRSCASCHKPEKSFTDGQKKSIARGYKGTVQRNAPTLINAVFSPRLFYDLRTKTLENQILHVLFDEKEFNLGMLNAMDRLRQSEEYVEMFKEAYPDQAHNPIHRYTLSTAMAAYVMSLNRFDTPFDQFVRGESEEISPQVRKGFNLFMGKAACGTCHFAPTFSGLVPPQFTEMESEILGVPVDKEGSELDPDPGRVAGLTLESFEIFERSFKTVTIREVANTAPYMHNGVYDNLEEVMDFYNRGGGEGLGLEVPYQTLPFDSLSLEMHEQQAIIAFMESLVHTQPHRAAPERLPAFPKESGYADRKIGGVY